MEGGGIVTNEVRRRLHDVCFSSIGKARIARLFARPVEQRQVHIAVDNHPPGLFRVSQIAPRLNNFCLLVEALQQRLCRQQREATRLTVTGQSPGRHAGERIQKAQIVGVSVVAPGDTQAKRAHMFFRHRAEFRFAAHLPRQPQLPGPEAGGPLHVVSQRIKTVLAGFRREFVAELR